MADKHQQAEKTAAEGLAEVLPTLEDSTRQLIENQAEDATDNLENEPDNLADDSQNSDVFTKISILELLKKYSIGRDALYSRMNYLQITTYKIGGKAHLDGEQLAHMDGLHEHIRATGRMEGYPIPEPTGPQPEAVSVEVPVQNQQTGAIEVATQQQMATTTPQVAPTKKRATGNNQTEAIASLVENAKNKAAGVLIAENMLAQQFIQNPELLPEELREKIQQSAQMPEVDPFAYANALVSFATEVIAA